MIYPFITISIAISELKKPATIRQQAVNQLKPDTNNGNAFVWEQANRVLKPY